VKVHRNRATSHSGTIDEVNEVDFEEKDVVAAAADVGANVGDPGAAAVPARSGWPFPRRFGKTIVRSQGAVMALCRVGSGPISEAVVCPQKIWPSTNRTWVKQKSVVTAKVLREMKIMYSYQFCVCVRVW